MRTGIIYRDLEMNAALFLCAAAPITDPAAIPGWRLIVVEMRTT